jgi:tetratricopeptide (TPR) repeat protein
VGKTAAPRTRTLVVLLLAAATLLAFAPVVDTGFVDYDDDVYVSANANIQHGIGAKGLRWALTSFYAANWHPVTWLSHMIDWKAYGPKPAGHHITSLLLHLASVLVLFLVLLRMTGAPGRSAFAAALFSVHPLHVESVAWLAERKDVLCALFWFLAIAAYVRWSEAPRLSRSAAVAVFAALALLSKAMAVTLPLTLLLLDFWPLGRKLPRAALAAVREKAPLFVLSAAAAGVTVMAQHAGQSIATVAACPFGQRLGNAAVACVLYLVKTAWPVQLAAFYPHPRGTLPAWKIVGAVGVLVLLSAAAVRLRRVRPYLLFGWLWYLVTLLPVIGLVQVGEQGMADRYTYVPLVGIFVAFSWGANDVIASLTARGDRRGLPRIAMAAAIAVVLILIGVTRFQIRFWKDGDTLFTRALAVTERNDVAHSHLGMLRARQGRLDEADEHFREALRIHPSSALVHLDLATNLILLGKMDEAEVEFRVALRLDPSDPRIHSNLGGLFELRGNLDEARSHFEEAVRLDPKFTAARIGLGTVFDRSGRLDDAVTQFREALRVDPASAEAHDRAGTALAQLGRHEEAYVHFAEAIRVDPLRADTQCNWGTALATQSRYREATSHFAEAIRLAPTHARAHFSLAAASFFLQDYAGAWREARLARTYGFEPSPGFLSMLSAKMSEPR